MQLGARQECVSGTTIPEKLARLKELGYDFLELSLSRDQVAALEPDSAKEYVAATERAGLPILSTSFGHFGGFAGLSAGDRDGIVEHIRAFMGFSRALGADVMLLATREESLDISEYVAVYREALAPVADEAAACGMRLALEHVGSFKPYTVASLVRAIGHPAVGMYFDMGNCLHVGENPLEQARICAPVTVQLHAKGGPVAPMAAMPLAPVREILQAAGYQGRCCLEIAGTEGDRGLREAMGLLKMAGYR